MTRKTVVAYVALVTLLRDTLGATPVSVMSDYERVLQSNWLLVSLHTAKIRYIFEKQFILDTPYLH